MPGLTSTLLMATQALLADQGALQVTSNNIANANTPGYTRERAILTENPPVPEGNILFGSGVSLDKIQSVRDALLELRISEENQQQGSAQAQVTAFQQVQGIFSDANQGIGTDLTAFFNSLSQLSTNPASIPLRQTVLTAAQNLANSFHQTSSDLTTIQTSLNLTVKQTVDQINTLTQQIAKLNVQVTNLQKLGQEPGELLDQETELIQQLSQLTDVSVIQTEAGQTITTAGGAALVVSGQSFDLQVSTDSTGLNHVLSQGRDLTSIIQGGKLGGTLQVRDQAIPDFFNQLDTLAGQFATAFNTAHTAGFDLAGNAGQPFFSATAGAGAANSFQVLITDPSLIAASSDGAAGSNGNIAQLTAVGTQPLASGASPLDTYSNLVFNVGNMTSQAHAQESASSLSLNQLNDQRGAVSGVSIDEESANLLVYQRAFEAAARIVTTVDELTQTVLTMGASG